MSWETFLKAHWGEEACLRGIAAADFFSVEVLTRGLNNELIEKPIDEPHLDGVVECQERLGGVLKYYYRRAA